MKKNLWVFAMCIFFGHQGIQAANVDLKTKTQELMRDNEMANWREGIENMRAIAAHKKPTAAQDQELINQLKEIQRDFFVQRNDFMSPGQNRELRLFSPLLTVQETLNWADTVEIIAAYVQKRNKALQQLLQELLAANAYLINSLRTIGEHLQSFNKPTALKIKDYIINLRNRQKQLSSISLEKLPNDGLDVMHALQSCISDLYTQAINELDAFVNSKAD